MPDKAIKRKPYYKNKTVNINKHKAQCSICNSPLKKDLELDYTYCIPLRVLEERYKFADVTISHHARAVGLDTKRDRKNFYWRMIESVDLNKMTVENALEAAKQLDRIEHKIDIREVPSNIQVIYSFGRPIAAVTRNAVDDSDRIPAAANAAEIPSLREEVPPV